MIFKGYRNNNIFLHDQNFRFLCDTASWSNMPIFFKHSYVAKVSLLQHIDSVRVFFSLVFFLSSFFFLLSFFFSWRCMFFAYYRDMDGPILTKLGRHVKGDNLQRLYEFQGHRSKVKVKTEGQRFFTFSPITFEPYKIQKKGRHTHDQ